MRTVHTIILAMLLGNALAQQDSLPTDQVTIIKDFEARIDDHSKVDLPAVLPQVDTTRSIVPYSISPKFLTMEYDAPKLKPLTMKPSPLPEGYPGYAKLAMGYPLMPHAELGYQHQQGTWRYGGKARYRAAFDLNQLEHQQFTDADVDVDVSKEFDAGFLLGASLGYGYDQRFFYGYDHDSLSFEAADIRQHFSQPRFSLHLNSIDAGSPWDYRIRNAFSHLTDNYSAQEWSNRSQGEASYTLRGKHLAQVQVDHHLIRNSTEDSETWNVLAVRPSFTYHHPKFRVKAGLNASLVEDGLRIFPDAEILANVWMKKVDVYLAWTGEAENVSFHSLTATNPFLVSHPLLGQKTTQYPHLGAKGRFQSVEASLELGYKMVEGQPLFANDFLGDDKRFAVFYDDVDYFTTQVEATWAIQEGLEWTLGLDFQSPRTDSLAKNYLDRPNLLAHTRLSYSQLLDGKLTIGTDLHFSTGPDYLSRQGSNERLDDFLDVSLFSRYQVRERWHIFLNGHNLLNQKYQRWNDYPNFGAQVQGGVFWKFG